MFSNSNKHKISELNDKINSLENKNSVLECKLETSKEINELNDKIKAFEVRNGILEENFEIIKKENSELLNKIKTLENKNNNLEDDLETIKKENLDLKNKIGTLENSIKNLQNIMDSRQPVYRLFNPQRLDHVFILGETKEITYKITSEGYRHDYIAFYAFPN